MTFHMKILFKKNAAMIVVCKTNCGTYVELSVYKNAIRHLPKSLSVPVVGTTAVLPQPMMRGIMSKMTPMEKQGI